MWLTHLPVSGVVGPAQSVHAVLELKFGDPVVVLGTTLDHYSCYFPGLAQVNLDPAWGSWRKDRKFNIRTRPIESNITACVCVCGHWVGTYCLKASSRNLHSSGLYWQWSWQRRRRQRAGSPWCSHPRRPGRAGTLWANQTHEPSTVIVLQDKTMDFTFLFFLNCKKKSPPFCSQVYTISRYLEMSGQGSGSVWAYTKQNWRLSHVFL